MIKRVRGKRTINKILIVEKEVLIPIALAASLDE